MMDKKTLQKTFLYGFFIWLIPFLISFPFFSKNGELLIKESLFNSIISFIFFTSFIYFLYRFIAKSENLKRKNILNFGITIFIEFVILDLIVLVGFFKVEMTKFLSEIVPIYFLTVIFCFFLSKAQNLMKN